MLCYIIICNAPRTPGNAWLSMAGLIMREQMIKDVQDWEREYIAMDVDLNEREIELLKGDNIKSHEGMMYGRMYNDWKRRKGYE